MWRNKLNVYWVYTNWFVFSNFYHPVYFNTYVYHIIYRVCHDTNISQLITLTWILLCTKGIFDNTPNWIQEMTSFNMTLLAAADKFIPTFTRKLKHPLWFLIWKHRMTKLRILLVNSFHLGSPNSLAKTPVAAESFK